MPTDDAPQSPPSAPPSVLPKKRPRGSNKCQRTKQYMVRCTPVEFKDIAANANAAGLRGGAYLRGLGLKGNPGLRARHVPPVRNEILEGIRGDLGRLNNNVNQIARNMNRGDFYDLPELRQVLQDYPAIRDAIFRALGKEPSLETRAWDEFISLVKDALQANPTAETVALPARLLLGIVSGIAAASAAPKPKPRKK